MIRNICAVALLLTAVLSTVSCLASGSTIPVDIMLVLDNSGSMRQNDPQFLTKRAVSDFVVRFGQDTQIGVVTFDQKAELVLPLSAGGRGETGQAVVATLGKLTYSGKLTDSPAGIERAVYELKNSGRKDAAKIIVFMTDGIVDTGDKTKDTERAKWLREDLAGQSQRLGIRIFGIAFTEQADYQLIQALGEKTNGGYFRALKTDDLPRIFEEIEASIQTWPGKPQDHGSPGEPRETYAWLVIMAGTVVLGGVISAVIAIKGRKSRGTGTGKTTAFGSPLPKPAKLPTAQLKDIREVSGKAEYLIASASFNIGRAGDNDVVVAKPTVSTRHATVNFHDNAFFLVDQRSTNGTFVNGEKLTAEFKLKHGDRIRFDQYEFMFVMEAYSDDMKTQLRGVVAEGDPAPAAQRSDDDATRLKDMCPNHPSWRATELCPVCRTAFCAKCMVEKDGRRICRSCGSDIG